MPKNTPKANIRILERDEVSFPARIPKSLMDTAGLLRDRYADLKRHVAKVRGEWSKVK